MIRPMAVKPTDEVFAKLLNPATPGRGGRQFHPGVSVSEKYWFSDAGTTIRAPLIARRRVNHVLVCGERAGAAFQYDRAAARPVAQANRHGEGQRAPVT